VNVRIRTVTVFDNPGFPVDRGTVAAAGRAAASIKAALESEGFEVQTVRFALPPFAPVVGGKAAHIDPLARQLEEACAEHAIDYATTALPCCKTTAIRQCDPEAPPRPADRRQLLTDLAPARSRLAAGVIHRTATNTPDGFANARFAALANVAAGVPFLPAAYHDAGGPAVAIGVEAADLAVQAFADAESPDEARRRLIDLIETGARHVAEAVGRSCPKAYRFGGVDFSLAPFPDAAHSIGTAFEALSGSRAGERARWRQRLRRIR
jgi:uncharacterized protein (UPF0210 family)